MHSVTTYTAVTVLMSVELSDTYTSEQECTIRRLISKLNCMGSFVPNTARKIRFVSSYGTPNIITKPKFSNRRQ